MNAHKWTRNLDRYSFFLSSDEYERPEITASWVCTKCGSVIEVQHAVQQRHEEETLCRLMQSNKVPEDCDIVIIQKIMSL